MCIGMRYSFWSNLLFFLNTIRKRAKQTYIFIFLCIFLKVLLPLIGIWLPNVVVEAVEGQKEIRELVITILIFGSFAVIFSVLEQYASGIVSAQSSEVCQEFSILLAYKSLDIDYEYLGDKEVTGQYAEANQSLWTGQRFLPHAGEYLIMLGSGILGVLTYTTILYRLPWQLLVLIAAASIVSFMCSDFGERERTSRQDIFGEAGRKLEYLTNVTRDAGNGKDIRLYQMYPWFYDTFGRLNRLLRRETAGVARKGFLGETVMAVMGILMEAVSYAILTGMAMDGKISIAEYVLYIGAALGLSSWIQMIARSLRKVMMLKYDISCIRRYLDIQDKNAGRLTGYPAITAGEVMEKGMPCEIVFDHVCYRYPGSDKNIIDNMSFKIDKGERVALVGRNGAGKTTCVKLLCGLLQPTEGNVLVNGVPISKMKHEECFRLFSVVFQDIHLFPFSVRENITWVKKGREDIPRLSECINKAGMADCIDSLPQGMDTKLVKELDNEAVDLSGGEQQKLLLARALYKDAPVLVLDEPTAALDPIAEDHIYQKYKEMTAEKTSIFISHRLASTRFCDSIFYLKDGRVAEKGSHEQLMELGGEYAGDFELQRQYYREGSE